MHIAHMTGMLQRGELYLRKKKVKKETSEDAAEPAKQSICILMWNYYTNNVLGQVRVESLVRVRLRWRRCRGLHLLRVFPSFRQFIWRSHAKCIIFECIAVSGSDSRRATAYCTSIRAHINNKLGGARHNSDLNILCISFSPGWKILNIDSWRAHYGCQNDPVHACRCMQEWIVSFIVDDYITCRLLAGEHTGHRFRCASFVVHSLSFHHFYDYVLWHDMQMEW